MRTAFFHRLESMYAEDDDLVVLTGDLGYKLFDGFRARDPRRFYDVGVAESNMIGLAAGLALSGKKPYCYSIIPFLVMRPFEQIRIDVAYQCLDVRLVGAGGGFAYGLEGITHHGLEDIALMRSLPDVTVVAPADRFEAERFAELSAAHRGPMYIRLGHTNEPDVHDRVPDIAIGRASVLRRGEGVALLSYGRTVSACLEAARLLEADGPGPTVVNAHTIKPLDADTVTGLFEDHDLVVVVEEHQYEGGLASAVAELVADAGCPGRLRRKCIDRTSRLTGRADHLRKRHGLAPGAIAAMIREEAGKLR